MYVYTLLARQDGDRDEAANLLREVQCRVVWQRPRKKTGGGTCET